MCYLLVSYVQDICKIAVTYCHLIKQRVKEVSANSDPGTAVNMVRGLECFRPAGLSSVSTVVASNMKQTLERVCASKPRNVSFHQRLVIRCSVRDANPPLPLILLVVRGSERPGVPAHSVGPSAPAAELGRATRAHGPCHKGGAVQ